MFKLIESAPVLLICANPIVTSEFLDCFIFKPLIKAKTLSTFQLLFQFGTI